MRSLALSEVEGEPLLGDSTKRIVTSPVAIVNLRRFLEATRDSGYRSFDAAVSELVDNSLQARARRIEIILPDPKQEPSEAHVAVLDDGAGMSPEQLAVALQFGGSHRFNDRNGLGRFGMGLPNSSFSQARRVEVYSWQRHSDTFLTYLDLDELLANDRRALPVPTSASLPQPYDEYADETGTLVIWRKLDRVKHTTWRILLKRLDLCLGRKFRYFLWAGHRIGINGELVAAVDPLFLSSETRTPDIIAQPFGEAIEYDVQPMPGVLAAASARITVRFSELPVNPLAALPNREKRLYGIANGAGVSIVRARREIDYGWYFLDKRRENYDDWWRCEIQFSPSLDEMFGVAHTKQGIRPSEDLRAILTHELTTIARELNRRARSRHLAFAEVQEQTSATTVAAKRDPQLRPLSLARQASIAESEPSENPARSPLDTAGRQPYRLLVEEIEEPRFYRVEVRNGEIVVIVNPRHELYHRLYGPLIADHSRSHAAVRASFELLLLALGRAELFDWNHNELTAIRQFIKEWSQTLSAFCRSAARDDDE
jgi:hypothetical protein